MAAKLKRLILHVEVQEHKPSEIIGVGVRENSHRRQVRGHFISAFLFYASGMNQSRVSSTWQIASYFNRKGHILSITMALPLPPGLTPTEVAFLCEMEMVTVIPRQRLETLNLLSVTLPLQPRVPQISPPFLPPTLTDNRKSRAQRHPSDHHTVRLSPSGLPSSSNANAEPIFSLHPGSSRPPSNGSSSTKQK
jgi:hypothetical protein